MAKQLHISGTESEEHVEINEAAEELRAAKMDQKRAGERVAKAMGLLVSRMMAAKVKGYGFHSQHGRYSLELDLPQPTVKLSFEADNDS
jgi:hypothetical protein